MAAIIAAFSVSSGRVASARKVPSSTPSAPGAIAAVLVVHHATAEQGLQDGSWDDGCDERERDEAGPLGKTSEADAPFRE
jgi:hypothetical protein